MSGLSEQQLAAVRRALRYTTRTASPETVQAVAEAVHEARGAEPETTGWRAAVEVLVEQTGPVLRRLLDAEAEAERLRAMEKAVGEFVAARAKYITAIRNCHPDNGHDYDRWQGHAAARRQLAQTLGLPVAWPAEGGGR